MSRLDALEKLADAALEMHIKFSEPDDDAAVAFICACNPATIKELIALVRMLGEALECHAAIGIRAEKALAAFDKWENGK